MREDVLVRECRLLHQYLMGGTAGSYVLEKYVVAHQHLPALTHPAGRFDAFLLTASQLHPWLQQLVQVYARIFAPAALVRKKAVLLLAIVECCAPALGSLQAARTRSPAVAIIVSALTVARFALVLLAATLVFAPIQIVHVVAGKAPRRLTGGAAAVSNVA